MVKTKDIFIKVLIGDEELQLETYTHEYRNLMMLLFDKIYLEDFGECKGMGRCGTCMIEIVESERADFLPWKKRRGDDAKGGIHEKQSKISMPDTGK